MPGGPDSRERYVSREAVDAISLAHDETAACVDRAGYRVVVSSRPYDHLPAAPRCHSADRLLRHEPGQAPAAGLWDYSQWLDLRGADAESYQAMQEATGTSFS